MQQRNQWKQDMGMLTKEQVQLKPEFNETCNRVQNSSKLKFVPSNHCIEHYSKLMMTLMDKTTDINDSQDMKIVMQ
jgi:hypothetical protein